MRGKQSKNLIPLLIAFLDAPYGTTNEALGSKVGIAGNTAGELLNSPLGDKVRDIRNIAWVRSRKLQNEKDKVAELKDRVQALENAPAIIEKCECCNETSALTEEVQKLKAELLQVVRENGKLAKENRDLKIALSPYLKRRTG